MGMNKVASVVNFCLLDKTFCLEFIYHILMHWIFFLDNNLIVIAKYHLKYLFVLCFKVWDKVILTKNFSCVTLNLI